MNITDGVRTGEERQDSLVRALTRASGSVALRNACVFIAVIIGGYTIQYFHVIITPLVIAVFLLLLIDGSSRTLEAKLPNWPAWLRTTIGVVAIVAGFTVVVGICLRYGQEFTSELLVIQSKVDAILKDAGDRLQVAQPISVEGMFKGHLTATVSSIFGTARGVLAEFLLVVIMLGFMLASRRAFARKADRMFKTTAGRSHASRIFVAVRNASEQYVGIQTLKAGLIAITAWVIMSLMGLPGALFLAFLIFLASYVPIVGGIAGALLPSVFALAKFDGPLRPAFLFAALTLSIFLVDNILMPKLQSDKLNLDPVVILLSLGFWGILLGLPGALLSTPLTVVVMAVASEFEGSRWLALALSKEGELIVEKPEL